MTTFQRGIILFILGIVPLFYCSTSYGIDVGTCAPNGCGSVTQDIPAFYYDSAAGTYENSSDLEQLLHDQFSGKNADCSNGIYTEWDLNPMANNYYRPILHQYRYGGESCGDSPDVCPVAVILSGNTILAMTYNDCTVGGPIYDYYAPGYGPEIWGDIPAGAKPQIWPTGIPLPWGDDPNATGPTVPNDLVDNSTPSPSDTSSAAPGQNDPGTSSGTPDSGGSDPPTTPTDPGSDPGTDPGTDPGSQDGGSQQSPADDCAAKCSPNGYYYHSGTCRCVSDNKFWNPNDSSATPTDPGSGSTEYGNNPAGKETGTDSPNDDGEGNDQTDKWLKAIKGDTSKLVGMTSGISEKLSTVIRQGNQQGKNLSAIAKNTAATGEAVRGLGTKLDGIDNELEGLGHDLEGIDNELEGIGSTLDDIKDNQEKGLSSDIGSPGDLPDAEYKGDEVEEVQEENPLADQFANYVTSGFPGLSVIQNFTASASGNSVISFTFYGKTVDVDFADWKTTLNIIGALLLSIAGFASFKIITA